MAGLDVTQVAGQPEAGVLSDEPCALHAETGWQKGHGVVFAGRGARSDFEKSACDALCWPRVTCGEACARGVRQGCGEESDWHALCRRVEGDISGVAGGVIAWRGQRDRAFADRHADGEPGWREAFEADRFMGSDAERLQRRLDAETPAVPSRFWIGDGESTAMFIGARATNQRVGAGGDRSHEEEPARAPRRDGRAVDRERRFRRGDRADDVGPGCG